MGFTGVESGLITVKPALPKEMIVFVGNFDDVKTKSNLPTYIVVDCSRFYSDEKERFFIIHLGAIKQFEVTRFDRFRDGGTTYITAKDDKNKTYEFFSPTPFDKNKVPTFQAEELEEVTKEEKENLIELLKLDLA